MECKLQSVQFNQQQRRPYIILQQHNILIFSNFRDNIMSFTFSKCLLPPLCTKLSKHYSARELIYAVPVQYSFQNTFHNAYMSNVSAPQCAGRDSPLL